MFSYPLSVFLDTNIFIGCKYNIGTDGVLQLLKNLIVAKKVKLYVSNIVVREVEKHIITDVSSAISALKSARKETLKHINLSLFEYTTLNSALRVPSKEEIEAQLIDNFRRFLSDCEVTYLDNAGVNVDAILNDYFSNTPPFEQKEQKKYEFPDAIIISKLKYEFSESIPVWVISADNGFKKALSNKKIFHCLSSVREFLDMINRQDTVYEKIVFYINEQKTQQEICEIITKQILSDDIEIDGMDYDRKGVCDGFDYDETTIVDITDLYIEFSSVDDIAEDYNLVTLKCSAKIYAICGFDDYDNAVWDSEDKKYIFLQREEMYEEHEPQFECNLKLLLNQEDGHFEFEVANVSYDLELNQETRVKREPYEPNDPALDAMGDMMDALEEYYNH